MDIVAPIFYDEVTNFICCPVRGALAFKTIGIVKREGFRIRPSIKYAKPELNEPGTGILPIIKSKFIKVI